jgi:hypothetical protein
MSRFFYEPVCRPLSRSIYSTADIVTPNLIMAAQVVAATGEKAKNIRDKKQVLDK